MIKLKELLSKLSEFSQIKYSHNKQIAEIDKKISDSITGFNFIEREIDKKISDNKRIQSISEATLQQANTLISNSQSTHPWLAQAFADVLYLHDCQTSKLLKSKNNAAPKAADALKSIAKEKRELLRELKECKYKIDYYETLFPSLENYVDEFDEDIEVVNLGESENDETLRYITKDEYSKLGAIERNQLALDRYKSSRHSNSHIGKMYERYIGHLYEKEGYDVEYFGIKKGLEDLGRDLICKKDRHLTEVVQCKNWSSRKKIHENVICQLYGTAIKYKMENKITEHNLFSENVKAVFVTTTKLSDTALEFATALDVKCLYIPMSFDYPMIKCNVNNNQLIYHLPFDQQYDRTIIRNKGERYVTTVQEAESYGFRRAKRWVQEM